MNNYFRAYTMTEADFEQIILESFQSETIDRDLRSNNEYYKLIEGGVAVFKHKLEYRLKCASLIHQSFVMEEASYGDKELEVEISSEQKV